MNVYILITRHSTISGAKTTGKTVSAAWVKKTYPQWKQLIEKSIDLVYSKLEICCPFQAFTLRKYGIIVSGPTPKDLVGSVSIENIIKSAKAIIEILLILF